MKQATIKKTISMSGIGLHKGTASEIKFSPADAGSGIFFENKGETYGLDVKYVSDTKRGTVLKKGKSEIHTVEHMLSAVKALGIDNLRVTIAGDEVPVLDGSALLFAAAIKKSGITFQEQKKKVFTLMEPVLLNETGKYMAAVPGKGFSVFYFSDFSKQGIAPEEYGIKVTPKSFVEEVSAARTFGFKNEISALKKAGLIKGASLKNAVVFDAGRPVNGKLRFVNELSRHKVLDIIGDLSFIEGEINMTVIAYKTGHTENIEMVKKLLSL
jgi:UDP-3-O-[3-hydroxymyristoyl] N-acetylglucosamine deacetylase